jgi:hypothetical protein
MMATITYQVTLTSDGKPAVSVTSDDPDAAREAIPWVAQTYATLLKDARAIPRPATTVVAQQAAEEPPTCAVHQGPMLRMSGRKGPFWSCHERLPNGTWCDYKPRG